MGLLVKTSWSLALWRFSPEEAVLFSSEDVLVSLLAGKCGIKCEREDTRSGEAAFE